MTEPTDAEIFVVAREAGLLPDNSHPAPETRAARKHSNAVQAFARAVLAKWGTPPAVAGEPVAWLSTDCIGERYLCFTKPKDSNSARPLVFGDTTPQPTQAQAGAMPLTDERIEALPLWKRFVGLWPETRREIVRTIEHHHGIKGGQHGTE